MDVSKHSVIYKKLLENLSRSKDEKKNTYVKKSFNQLTQFVGDEMTSFGIRKVDHIVNSAITAVNEIGLGRTSVTALFLYHVITNSELEIDDIARDYNESTVTIAKGMLKISAIGEASKSSQAENYRRLIISLAKDVRVILIRIAEQLELMRSSKEMPGEEQIRVASEASYLYAPLAHRLGLYLIKSEMEDLSLKYTDKDTYQLIAKKLDETMVARKAFIADFIKPIRAKLEAMGFRFEIKGRPKSIHSIWNKMHNKGVAFEDIYDLFAIRIILNSELKTEKADCWQAYSAVTEIFQPNPSRLRDWISVPKTNGYESLHTTVIGTDGKWVEVQIRTDRMNEIAEKGVAAHWKYKGLSSEQGIDEWLATIRDILESPEQDAGNFIDDFKLSLYSKEVFVFTPKGDLRKFPKGASVLDFAFEIHTEVGSTCIGAKINGRAVPIRYKLQNGDKIEILTSKNQKPTLDWLNYTVSSKAQKKIRQKVNEEKALEADKGKETIMRRFKNWKIDYNDEIIRDLLKNFKLPNAQDFYFLIASEKISITEIKDFLNRKDEEVTETKTLENLEVQESKQTREKAEDFLIIDEKVANIDYKLSQCCNPVLGDNVFGFVTINEGIKIHRTNCPNAANMIARYGYRVVKAKWTRKGPEPVFPVDIKISGEDQDGILTRISEALARDSAVNIRSFNLNADEGEFSGIIKITVRDLEHLDWLIGNLSKIKGIYSVGRVEGSRS